MMAAKLAHQKHLEAQQRRNKQAQAMAEKRQRIGAHKRGLFKVDMKQHPTICVIPAASLAKELPGLVQSVPFVVCSIVQLCVSRCPFGF